MPELMEPAIDIPRLSVVLPVYNAAHFLREALGSVLSQDFGDFECIAIDDGSTDASAEILDEHGRRDARLRVIHQPNAGIVEALNRGIGLARAPLIARMDADDVCLPGRFTAQMRHFSGRDDLGVLGGQVQLIDDDGGPLRLVDYPAGGDELKGFLEEGSPLAHPAVMFRKAAIESAGLYRQAFRHAEDYDLWLRVAEAGYAIENLKIPLIKYRQHAAKISVVHRRQQALATLAAQCAHRARMAKLPDPTAGLDHLDEQVFDLFPQALMDDFRERLFAVRMGAPSFATEQDLVQALQDFERLPANLQRTRGGASFLIQAGLGAWKLRLHSLALTAITRALVVAPAQVGMGGLGKASRLLRRLISSPDESSPGKSRSSNAA